MLAVSYVCCTPVKHHDLAGFRVDVLILLVNILFITLLLVLLLLPLV